MPRSEAVALVGRTKLAPSPDCVVLLTVQGGGLKLATAMYKTMQDGRQEKIQVFWDVELCGHWSSSW